MAVPRKRKMAASHSVINRRDVERTLTALQDKGIIDLDAPLRDAIPELARRMVKYKEAAHWWIIAQGDNPHAVCECDF
jgi:DNA-binding transcriptional regulator YhcF (GntR family)